MAEEEFDVNDMPTTDRYRIPYPGADNLVRFAADQFGAMAQAIDTQLGNVDDRATDAAHATIVRPTLDQLQQSDPVQGQLGYVTADPITDNIGLWMWNGASWSKVSGATPMTVVEPTLAELQDVIDLSEGVFGLVSDDPVASNNGVYVFNNGSWAPIAGTTGGTLAADTLAQLESTTAPTGTLAYVSADSDETNDGVYVRTAQGAWETVGGGSDYGVFYCNGDITASVKNTPQGSNLGNVYTYVTDIAKPFIIVGKAFGSTIFRTISGGEYDGALGITLKPGYYDSLVPDITIDSKVQYSESPYYPQYVNHGGNGTWQMKPKLIEGEYASVDGGYVVTSQATFVIASDAYSVSQVNAPIQAVAQGKASVFTKGMVGKVVQ